MYLQVPSAATLKLTSLINTCIQQQHYYMYTERVVLPVHLLAYSTLVTLYLILVFFFLSSFLGHEFSFFVCLLLELD